MPQKNTDHSSRDTMLLTIILPSSAGRSPQFHAAMLCFPQGTPQLVLGQLQNESLLRSLTECLEDSGEGLEGVAGQMAEDGCSDVEIFPMETIGFYDLSVCSAEN